MQSTFFQSRSCVFAFDYKNNTSYHLKIHENIEGKLSLTSIIIVSICNLKTFYIHVCVFLNLSCSLHKKRLPFVSYSQSLFASHPSIPKQGECNLIRLESWNQKKKRKLSWSTPHSSLLELAGLQ